MTLLSETPRVITLGWTPPANCIGYVYYVNDKRVANTWNPTVQQARFGKVEGAVYRVIALAAGATGTYPSDVSENPENYSVDPYGSAVYSH